MTAIPVPGTVYVLGGGPGDPDLLTVRARRVLEAAGTVLYADSLVDPRVLEIVNPAAAVIGTSGMTLEPVVAELAAAARRGEVVARLHSGDPGVYGAVSEQLARLDALGVAWEVVPGVPSPMAAAAAIGCEMTVPEVAQAIVFCRVRGRTALPDGQDLRALARPGVSLCIFLSTAYAAETVAALREGGVDAATPAVIAERVSWPDERVSWGTVGDLAARLRDLGIRRHALILVGPAFERAAARRRSSLYSASHAHIFRPAGMPADRRLAQGVAVYALTAAGAGVGARVTAGLGDARLHLPARLAGAVAGAVPETATARGVVARLMATREAVVLVMATGAAVRLGAPHLKDKLRDPALVSVDDLGRYVVPLAGAHAGGGNELARRVAETLGALPVVTTASDRRSWPPPDELARARGWRIERPRALAAVTAALLDGDPVGLVQTAGAPFESLGAWPASLCRHADLGALRAAAPRAALVVTDTIVGGAEPSWAVLHPPTLVVGIGCESGVGEGRIETAVDGALATAGLAAGAVAGVATVDRKSGEPGLAALCESRGWPLTGFPAAALREVSVPTPSPIVDAAVGTPSVAEAAALLAAGSGATLALRKRIDGRVTVAVARRSCP